MGEEEGEQSNQSNLTCIGLSEGVPVEEKQACVPKTWFFVFFCKSNFCCLEFHMNGKKLLFVKYS